MGFLTRDTYHRLLHGFTQHAALHTALQALERVCHVWSPWTGHVREELVHADHGQTTGQQVLGS